jgi:hypothetical protein
MNKSVYTGEKSVYLISALTANPLKRLVAEEGLEPPTRGL